MRTLSIFMIFAGLLALSAASCKNQERLAEENRRDTLQSNAKAQGTSLQIEFVKGQAHNHPSFAVWVETMQEEYIQTLFVSQYVASGIFGYGQDGNQWKREPGKAYRPASLPYWAHKRNQKNEKGGYIPTKENPVPDAYSGATPPKNFVLYTQTDKPLPQKFRLLVEVNQPWDWNKYWTNNKYPDDADYKTSCQPALVYAVSVSLDTERTLHLNPIGHSHYAGKNGKLYTNLSTITTAFDIFKQISVRVK